MPKAAGDLYARRPQDGKCNEPQSSGCGIAIIYHLRREAGGGDDRRDGAQANLPHLYVDPRRSIHRSAGEASALPDLYDALSYAASQSFGEGVRSSGGHSILYDSLHHAGGENVVAYRTTDIQDVVQTDHCEISVSAAAHQIEARKLMI